MSSKPRNDHILLPWIAKAITSFGEAYNSYSIKGLEHIPAHSGALIVLYHGLVPLDFWYFGLKVYQELGRVPHALVDRWLVRTPGLAWLTDAVGAVEGRREVAAQLLREGALVGVAPGGVREAISGAENNYRLIWRERKGFARIALEAGVPIIPGFTENVEGLYRAPLAGHPVLQKLYERTRLPLVPIVGLGPLPFPVKLTTWLGEPIHPIAQETDTSLAKRTAEAIAQLISKHQSKNKGLTELIGENLFPKTD